jgi:hypothetical protein
VPFELHLTPADDGTTQRLLLGGKVVLDLPAGPAWEYDEPADYPDPALAPYCPVPAAPGRVVFEAVRVGSTTLAYLRDGGPDRFDIPVDIVDGAGAAPPSTQLAGVVLRVQDAGSTVHVPRNGVVLVELPGRGDGTDPESVAIGSGGRLVAHCLLDPQVDAGVWRTRLKVTAVEEGTAELVVPYRDATSSGAGREAVFRATVVVDPVPGSGAASPSPTGSGAGAPFVLDLGPVDAGRTAEVLRGGKVVVTLPDPDGPGAAWVVLDSAGMQEQLVWSCGGISDTFTTPVDEGPVVLEVGAAVGTVDLALVYVPNDEGLPSEWDVRDRFTATVRIVDGPSAARPSSAIEGVAVGAEDDGRTVAVDRNGTVRITLYGQHGLGRDWELVHADAQLEAFCPRRVLSEGPGPEDMYWMNQFVFTAMAPGTAEVRLAYRDAADPAGAPLDTYRLTVTIR